MCKDDSVGTHQGEVRLILMATLKTASEQCTKG